MLKKFALGAAALLALTIPTGAALAHDGYGSYDDYSQHAQDHQEHSGYHDQESYAHARAHAEGFYSPGEHAAWHENAARAHEAFHDDHPNTWHDHYDRGYGYGGGYYHHHHHRHWWGY